MQCGVHELAIIGQTCKSGQQALPAATLVRQASKVTLHVRCNDGPQLTDNLWSPTCDVAQNNGHITDMQLTID